MAIAGRHKTEHASKILRFLVFIIKNNFQLLIILRAIKKIPNKTDFFRRTTLAYSIDTETSGIIQFAKNEIIPKYSLKWKKLWQELIMKTGLLHLEPCVFSP